MLLKHSARGDEKIFTTYQNVEASSLTTGFAAAIATASASFNGTQVMFASSAAADRKQNWIGIAAADIAPNAYGLIQQYGPCASVYISNVGSSITINVGDALAPGALSGGLFCLAAPTWLASGFGVVIASNTPPAVSATGWMSGFIRHML